MFITFEGVDGSGKSTQARLTHNFLTELGYKVLLTREPGGTAIGMQIREILLDKMENVAMHAHTELLLFCASRAQIVAEVIQPHLESGGIVLCDRYIDSTYAYQGYGHGLNLKTLRNIITFATSGLLPDLTLYMEITPEQSLRRRAEGMLFGEAWNRLDDKEMAFHQRVYKGYRELLLAEPARFAEIDATQATDDVQTAIRRELSQWLDLPQLHLSEHENGTQKR